MKGYFDRIEDNAYAVIIVEEHSKQYVLPISKLPSESKPGIWFNLSITDDKINTININEEKTASSAAQTAQLMAKLQEKRTGSKFKK